MKMKTRTNQKGFAALQTLLLLIIVAMIAGVGYYVWHANKSASDTLARASQESQNAPVLKSAKKPTSTQSNANQSYLLIKEWGVKLPLSTNDIGTYYTAPTSYKLSQTVSLFDKGIDEFKNSKGISCKNPGYPMFIITRVKTNDVTTSTDENSSNFIVETNASMFKSFNFDKIYSYAGRPIHQSAPQCEVIANNGNSGDPAVDAKYASVWLALQDSFDHMQR
jgi:hypothetical protein